MPLKRSRPLVRDVLRQDPPSAICNSEARGIEAATRAFPKMETVALAALAKGFSIPDSLSPGRVPRC